jgi:hypothetical protein
MAATDLLIWSIVIHLVIDWLGQNEWIAVNKAKRRLSGNVIVRVDDQEGAGVKPASSWWDRHPAAYVHAGMHGAAQLLVFPWPAALAIGVTHLLIDTRVPVAWWSRLIRQTQPKQPYYAKGWAPGDPRSAPSVVVPIPQSVMDIGAEVRIWADQVWHFAVIALAALLAAA